MSVRSWRIAELHSAIFIAIKQSVATVSKWLGMCQPVPNCNGGWKKLGRSAVSNRILAMTRRDFGKPHFHYAKRRFVKTHALSLLGTTRLLSRRWS